MKYEFEFISFGIGYSGARMESRDMSFVPGLLLIGSHWLPGYDIKYEKH